MCGRFALFHSPEILVSVFDMSLPPTIEPRDNIAPTEQALIIHEDTEGCKFSQAWWGRVSHWCKNPVIGSHMINARAERVVNKPGFCDMIKQHRCVVPASGYYEWNHKGAESKQYYISMSDGSIIGFAGLWEQWKSPEDKIIYSFTILTTEANELVMPIHNRMPVILRPEDYSLWLNKDLHDTEQLQHLYRPFPANLLTMCCMPGPPL